MMAKIEPNAFYPIYLDNLFNVSISMSMVVLSLIFVLLLENLSISLIINSDIKKFIFKEYRSQLPLLYYLGSLNANFFCFPIIL